MIPSGVDPCAVGAKVRPPMAPGEAWRPDLTSRVELLLNPFFIGIDLMERLLLVNFERDPDSIYLGFEPQVFDDLVNGRGHVVLGWRRDGKVDVYHQPSVQVNPAKYDIAGRGLGHVVERELAGATYEVEARGVQAHYEFGDVHHRQVVIHIRERNPCPRRPFGLLAPMGASAEAPSALPLVLLHDFYFVRVRHTTFEIGIDGRRHQPDVLPIPMDFTRMFFTRYSPKPLIATLNPAFDGELVPLGIPSGQTEVPAGEAVLALDWSGGQPALARLTRANPVHPIELRFEPAFPPVQGLSDGACRTGRFEVVGHPATGRVAGGYAVESRAGTVTITMNPAEGWLPRPTKASLRFLYAVARTFRDWPTTYAWTARLRPGEGGTWVMRSAWRRTGIHPRMDRPNREGNR